MLDYFLCQLFFLDPIRARSSSYLPAHHATKYNNTSDTIVTLMVAPFMMWVDSFVAETFILQLLGLKVDFCTMDLVWYIQQDVTEV